MTTTIRTASGHLIQGHWTPKLRMRVRKARGSGAILVTCPIHGQVRTHYVWKLAWNAAYRHIELHH